MQKTDTIGSIIRYHREESKMPLRKLAYKLDIDQSTLSKIERDERKINPELLDKISDIFNIVILWLIKLVIWNHFLKSLE